MRAAKRRKNAAHGAKPWVVGAERTSPEGAKELLQHRFRTDARNHAPFKLPRNAHYPPLVAVK